MKITANSQASFSVPRVLPEKAMANMGKTHMNMEPKKMTKKNPAAVSIAIAFLCVYKYKGIWKKVAMKRVEEYSVEGMEESEKP